MGLDAIVKYVWEQMLCNDIRMQIFHFKDDSGK